MFAKIRNELTLRYSMVMMLLMMAFIIVSSTGMLWILYREEQQDLRSFTEREAREQTAMYKERAAFFQFPYQEEENADSGAKIFYYVFDKHGQQAAAEEAEGGIHTGVLGIIGNWSAPDGVVELKKFHDANGDRAVALLCSMKIYDGTEVVGTVFVGENISSYYQRIKILLIMMVVLCILFLVIAAFAGHFLAGRAIIPIRQAFSRQREFVADASHELRTPLSVMLTSVDVIQTEEDQKLSPLSIQVLDDMKDEIRRMTKLVTDLLTLARADAGAVNIIKERFDLAIVAEQVLRSLQPLAATKGIELAIAGEAEIAVLADRERMKQLLLILIDNAVKYTPAGGRVGVLLKTAAAPKPCVTITVEDTGAGIPDDQRALIFERFYRIDKARSRQEGGTGLGLPIAKWIVDAHGGTIKVTSTFGEGSSFIVTLPV
ncbi:sensor histidine kinase [Sporomusa aerivorans]|uniref:sensor histidine kinase n=1 Tax=Sporomusa aerivorans TaxID=204936 RepID=UPI00352A2153